MIRQVIASASSRHKLMQFDTHSVPPRSRPVARSQADHTALPPFLTVLQFGYRRITEGARLPAGKKLAGDEFPELVFS